MAIKKYLIWQLSFRFYLKQLILYVKIYWYGFRLNVKQSVSHSAIKEGTMQKLEVILLRSGELGKRGHRSEVMRLADEIRKQNPQQKIAVFTRQGIDTDLCFQIYHDHEIGAGGSRLGFALVSVLKEFGLVNHSVWNVLA